MKNKFPCESGDPTVLAKLDNCTGMDPHEKAQLRGMYMNACYLGGRESIEARVRVLNIAVRINQSQNNKRS